MRRGVMRKRLGRHWHGLDRGTENWLWHSVGQHCGQEADESARFDRRQMESLDTAVTAPQAEVHETAIEVPRGAQTDATLVDRQMPPVEGKLIDRPGIHPFSMASAAGQGKGPAR